MLKAYKNVFTNCSPIQDSRVTQYRGNTCRLGRYVRKITTEFRHEKIKIVVFKEVSSQESVPQTNNSWEVLRMELPLHQENTMEMAMIHPKVCDIEVE